MKYWEPIVHHKFSPAHSLRRNDVHEVFRAFVWIAFCKIVYISSIFVDFGRLNLIVVKWILWCSISPVLLLFGMSKLTIIMSQVLDILFFFSILLFKLYNNNKYQQISLLKYNIAQFSFPIFFFFFPDRFNVNGHLKLDCWLKT